MDLKGGKGGGYFSRTARRRKRVRVGAEEDEDETWAGEDDRDEAPEGQTEIILKG